jgi:hypothetical protein
MTRIVSSDGRYFSWQLRLTVFSSQIIRVIRVIRVNFSFYYSRTKKKVNKALLVIVNVTRYPGQVDPDR